MWVFYTPTDLARADQLPRSCSTIKILKTVDRLKTSCRSDCEEKEPSGLQREHSKSKGSIELGRALVLRIHHDREHGDGPPGSKDPLDRIGQKKLTDTLSTHSLVAGEPTDQSSRNRVVARQLVCYLLWQALQREGQRAQAIEANYAQVGCDRNEDSRHISLLILACPKAEPIVEIRLAAGKSRSIVVLPERLDREIQAAHLVISR